MKVLIIVAMMLKVCYLGWHKRWNKKKSDIGLDKKGHYNYIVLKDVYYLRYQENKTP